MTTSRPRADRFPYIWATICVLLVAVAATLGLALYSATKANDSLHAAQRASREAQSIADCINENLGKRQAPAQRDSAAQLKFIVAVNKLFLVPPNATPQQRLAAARQFQEVVENVRVTLLTDKRAKQANPLGTC